MKPTPKKQLWMREYEKYCSHLSPESHGKLCWDTANHLYNLGHTPQVAAHLIYKKGAKK